MNLINNYYIGFCNLINVYYIGFYTLINTVHYESYIMKFLILINIRNAF